MAPNFGHSFKATAGSNVHRFATTGLQFHCIKLNWHFCYISDDSWELYFIFLEGKCVWLIKMISGIKFSFNKKMTGVWSNRLSICRCILFFFFKYWIKQQFAKMLNAKIVGRSTLVLRLSTFPLMLVAAAEVVANTLDWTP